MYIQEFIALYSAFQHITRPYAAISILINESETSVSSQGSCTLLFESALKKGFPIPVISRFLWLSFAHHALRASHGNSTIFPILPHFPLTSLSMHSL